ncbi:exosporium leader peptide-containing protein [Bacillus mycoides]|nr:exosporium leader peptide-containing protein [Bacillus mycoides]MCQ6529845.1 exosporium leader peptide-containing protein [Bacillus mycoides]
MKENEKIEPHLLDTYLIGKALDRNLIGPTFPPIPSITLPVGHLIYSLL